MKFKSKEQQAAVMAKYPKGKSSSSSRTTDSYNGYEGRKAIGVQDIHNELMETSKSFRESTPRTRETRVKRLHTIRINQKQKRQETFKPRKMHKAGDTRRISAEEPLYDNKGRRIDGKEIGIISIKGNQATAIIHGEKQTIPTAYLIPPEWFNKLSSDEMRKTIEYQRP